jgi:hypothetical protein
VGHRMDPYQTLSNEQIIVYIEVLLKIRDKTPRILYKLPTDSELIG